MRESRSCCVWPEDAQTVRIGKQGLEVPNRVIVPYITGDGIGSDIAPVMKQVVNAAVKQAYAGERSIAWMEVYAGEHAAALYDNVYLPNETIDAFRRCIIGIKGPLKTPIAGGFASLNVALRKRLKLYACQRPIRYFTGVPSPLLSPEKVDMVIFRENLEDVYSGIEWPGASDESTQLIQYLEDRLGVEDIPFTEDCGVGIKLASRIASQQLVRKAIQYAIDHNKPSVTLVHKGNIMKYTEGAFRSWGYQLAKEEFGAELLDGGPWMSFKHPQSSESIVIKDVIADAFFQQILLHPEEYSVIATTNLNGDYISDALAAQVGGIGISPGVNCNDDVFIFEATHGTADKYADKDQANPSSLILSAEMMLRHMKWTEAADLIIRGIERTIQNKTVTLDFYRAIGKSGQLLSCSEFGQMIAKNML